MCTSLTLTNQGQQHFLARTMDFGFQLEGRPVVIPRNYVWKKQFNGSQQTKYGFLGTGRNLGEYFLADGINEKGLAIAELYFLNEAKYSSEEKEASINLAPHEFIIWLLGEIESISELRKRITEIQIVEKEVPVLGFVPPLHYIVTDKTGETVVIESDSGELVIKDNPVGVMTNSPEFGWHLKNLNNYLSVQPNNFSNKIINEYEIKPFGQGSGTYGLPGGYTSPERFVRTVYLRALIESGKTADDSLNAMFKILDNVTIPKGVNIKNDGSIDYTQYRAVFDVSNGTYYFNPYETQEVFELTLTEELLTKDEPVEFKYSTDFKTTKINE
ncbi:choloylglycine hydrolase family protein [Enterococcus sp. DIV0756]|uniref:choloylglycine hydrolase family protein n=1 Tax=Enterococcus sp. DIV0756 TaxID=2774636 RepID=UPI003F27FA7D